MENILDNVKELTATHLNRLVELNQILDRELFGTFLTFCAFLLASKANTNCPSKKFYIECYIAIKDIIRRQLKEYREMTQNYIVTRRFQMFRT